MITRELYLNKIRPFYKSEMIKVLTGIRRCGKSTLIKQIIEEIDSANIIYINFEDFQYNEIKTAKDLNNYITTRVSSERYYLFFDEIQVVEEWELAINSFRSTLDVSIFLTGSNSKLLSGELATNLAGRYVSFEIQPFAFEEYLAMTDSQDIDTAFNTYLLWGGMPQAIMYENIEEKRVILTDIYNSIILKDIIARYKVTNVDLFGRIIEYVVTTPSQTFSATSIRKYLEKENIKTSNTTLYTYLNYLQEVYLIKCVRSYDIRGKRILDRQDKYYLNDLGLGQIRNQSARMQVGAYLENIVYNHLSIAGYDVTVGKTRQYEVDFIATMGAEKKYIQVAYLLTDESVVEREFRSLLEIDDNHPKYVLSMDKFDFSQNGVKHMNVIDFLLNPNTVD